MGLGAWRGRGVTGCGRSDPRSCVMLRGDARGRVPDWGGGPSGRSGRRRRRPCCRGDAGARTGDPSQPWIVQPVDTRAPSGLYPPLDPSKNNPLWPAVYAPPQPGSPPPPPSRRPVAGRGIKLALRLLVNSRPLQFDHLDQFADWPQLGSSVAASFR